MSKLEEVLNFINKYNNGEINTSLISTSIKRKEIDEDVYIINPNLKLKVERVPFSEGTALSAPANIIKFKVNDSEIDKDTFDAILDANKNNVTKLNKTEDKIDLIYNFDQVNISFRVIRFKQMENIFVKLYDELINEIDFGKDLEAIYDFILDYFYGGKNCNEVIVGYDGIDILEMNKYFRQNEDVTKVYYKYFEIIHEHYKEPLKVRIKDSYNSKINTVCPVTRYYIDENNLWGWMEVDNNKLNGIILTSSSITNVSDKYEILKEVYVNLDKDNFFKYSYRKGKPVMLSLENLTAKQRIEKCRELSYII